MRYEITILGVVQGVGYRPFVAAWLNNFISKEVSATAAEW